jgi:hypothetical protein
MSIRVEGKRLAMRVTTGIGVISLAVTGVASIALWQQTVQSKTPSGTIGQDGTGAGTGRGPADANQGNDDGGGFSQNQQVAPVAPSQGGGFHAQSSGS